ncbi:uncharacterized protein LOC112451830 isoform X2 [Temnothorax curvispinosus]|uniref:Uncharacterized protein LOC112451830 isoform X2 n=1 Tax=Temnothorax curvispinosus TaxID=300111 RepID=A0A6J1PDA8_9HYME|nr:uncharacterized protein LOC112451830 isoform X2 [Temnothorax curvispinosus]
MTRVFGVRGLVGVGVALLACLLFPSSLPRLAGEGTEMSRMLAVDFEVFGIVQGVFFRKIYVYLSSPGKLTRRRLVCLRVTVHAKTRQGAGAEGMVHEHPERYRGRPPGGGEGAGRGDETVASPYRKPSVADR